jgi:hypothetical protein
MTSFYLLKDATTVLVFHITCVGAAVGLSLRDVQAVMKSLFAGAAILMI